MVFCYQDRPCRQDCPLTIKVGFLVESREISWNFVSESSCDT